jgi:gibberellin 2-oxidase
MPRTAGNIELLQQNLLTTNSCTMAPSATERVDSQTTSSGRILVKPWSRPKPTSEDLEWAPLVKIDLSRFDEPGGKQELAKQLYDAVTRVGFWVVVNTGIDDTRVLRQFSIGNTFFKEPLEEKRKNPCNFAEGEYFGYRENSRWIGDTGVKENIEMVRRFQHDKAHTNNFVAQHPQSDPSV